MTIRGRFLRRVLTGLGLVCILVLADVVLHAAFTDEEWQAPMTVSGAIGHHATGRNLGATVHSAEFATTVTAENGWQGATTGVWLVVDASVEAVSQEEAAGLSTVLLTVGSTQYSGSTRPGSQTIVNIPLSVGIPHTGTIVFELPKNIADLPGAKAATLRLGAAADVRLDSEISIPLDLAAMKKVEAVHFDAPKWGATT